MPGRAVTFGVAALCLLTGLLAARAQEADWLAWLYDPANGRMTLVDSAGQVYDAFNLPLPEGCDLYPFEVAVSRSGSRIAYVPSSSAGDARRVLVYDANARSLAADYDLASIFADGMGFPGDDAYTFNETGAALAFGFSLEDGGWQILILDLTSGRATLTLRSASPAAGDVPNEPGMTPVVRRYQGSRVTFTMAQGGAAEGPLERGSYTWDVAANTVRVDTTYPALDSDTFAPTGEVIMAVSDPNLPNAGASFVLPQTNTLYVYDPQADEAYPFYYAADLSLYFPRFIQNGARVLVSGFDASGGSIRLVINRDGTPVGVWTPPDGAAVSSVKGTASGFIYTADAVTPSGGRATLLAVDTRDGLDGGAPVWSSPPGSYPRLMWVRDQRITTPIPGAKPWARLGD